MGIFSSIKNAIFGKDEDEQTAAAAPAAAAAKPAAPAAGQAAKPAAPKAISEVDVEAKLDAMAGADKLNWRDSIVDLMKLVGLDASYDERKELAAELGKADYEGSAEDNIWLHKQVMKQMAAAGGKVPAKLAD